MHREGADAVPVAALIRSEFERQDLDPIGADALAHATLGAVFSATESKTGALTLVLINKTPKATITVPLSITGHDGGASKLWRFSAEKPNQLSAEVGPKVSGGKASISLPPYSATLVRIGGK